MHEPDTHEVEKPEVQIPVVVFFHADTEDQVEVRERIEQIRHVIEEALGDEDNDLRGFTYSEVRLGRATTNGAFGRRALDV